MSDNENFCRRLEISINKTTHQRTKFTKQIHKFQTTSNLYLLSKLIEKAAETQLQNHFDDQSVLSIHQSAYRKNVV